MLSRVISRRISSVNNILLNIRLYSLDFNEAADRTSVNRKSFVSKHYEVAPGELKQVLDALDSQTRTTDDGKLEVRVCRLCSKGNKTNLDNLWKLRVNRDGSFHCFRCAKHGSWFDLKHRTAGGGASEFCDDGFGDESEKMDEVELKETISEVDSQQFFDCTKLLFDSIDSSSDSNTEKPLDAAQTSITSEKGKKSNVSIVQRAIEVKNYLVDVRKLSLNICQRYGVGVGVQDFLSGKAKSKSTASWVSETCVTFPWMIPVSDKTSEENSSEFQIIRMKYRSLSTKGKQRMLPKGGAWGFFGWHLVRPEHTSILITEGEYDALAVAQVLDTVKEDDPHASLLKSMVSVSLPNGCHSLPLDLLPLLERFNRIYLWLDNDEGGIAASEKFSRKLGIHRCYIIRPQANCLVQPKDANDALRDSRVNMLDMIVHATQLRHNRIISFADVRQEVLQSFLRTSSSPYEGTICSSLPTLTKLTKGFRSGELVIFTGPTGAGKTTLLSQLSLDFVLQGAPTLWGSFEIKNSRLLQKMLSQYHAFIGESTKGKGKSSAIVGGNIAKFSPEQLELVANDFEQLPFQFLNFHGGSSLTEVLDAMDFAVYKYDIKHIILDNLQFMTPSKKGTGGNFEKFDAQDLAIESFRQFATTKNVNIILVIHPRKEEDRFALGLSSIFGTAKATQEADVVLILQHKPADMPTGLNGGGTKDEYSSYGQGYGKSKAPEPNERVGTVTYLEVKKNRYDGAVGRVNMEFSPATLTFFEP